MSKLICLMAALMVLASCGAEGEPIRPNFGVGVNVSGSGVHVGSSVGVSKGPVSVSVGL